MRAVRRIGKVKDGFDVLKLLCKKETEGLAPKESFTRTQHFIQSQTCPTTNCGHALVDMPQTRKFREISCYRMEASSISPFLV